MTDAMTERVKAFLNEFAADEYGSLEEWQYDAELLRKAIVEEQKDPTSWGFDDKGEI